jgi:hypothetical protein
VDIIILIFLAVRIGRLAESKGQSSLKWRAYLVLGWIAGEITGGILGMMIFGNDLVSCALVGLAGAFGVYFIIKNNLSKLPDTSHDDDINNIGSF